MNDEEDCAHIHTFQRTTITKLKNNPAATLLDEGKFRGGTAWAVFSLPKDLITFRTKRTSRGVFVAEKLRKGTGKSSAERV